MKKSMKKSVKPVKKPAKKEIKKHKKAVQFMAEPVFIMPSINNLFGSHDIYDFDLNSVVKSQAMKKKNTYFSDGEDFNEQEFSFMEDDDNMSVGSVDSSFGRPLNTSLPVYTSSILQDDTKTTWSSEKNRTLNPLFDTSLSDESSKEISFSSDISPTKSKKKSRFSTVYDDFNTPEKYPTFKSFKQAPEEDEYDSRQIALAAEDYGDPDINQFLENLGSVKTPSPKKQKSKTPKKSKK
jgi:hypothetical protein